MHGFNKICPFLIKLLCCCSGLAQMIKPKPIAASIAVMHYAREGIA